MSNRGAGRSERLFTIGLTVICVVMAVELVLLVRQNRQLKATVTELQEQAFAARQQAVAALEPGDRVGPLSLSALSGETVEIAYEDPDLETLLFIFSPQCPACEENVGDFKELARTLRGQAGRVYYVSTSEEEPTRRFAEEHELSAPVLLADAAALGDYKVTYIPTTVVVGTGGVVKKVWVGPLLD